MKRKRAFIGGLAFVLLLLLAVAVYLYGYLKNISLRQATTAIDSLGAMAPVVFVMMCILRGLVFLPCGILSALGGMLFGTLPGTVLTLIGLTAGSVCTFYMARGLGKEWVQRIPGHKYDRYEGYVSRDSFYSVFLMRVVPILPFDAVSCIAGLSRARVDKFVSGTLAGSLPGVFIYVYFGDSIKSMSLKRVIFSVLFITAFAVIPFLYRYLMKLKQKTA
ncbi:MAG: hypothetical protein APF77_15425 [Clostridia bacterium BRH_c25]|nr:MAG: hypothetical protein APF77_15425 [Clostridia bacterium BRH_c25]